MGCSATGATTVSCELAAGKEPTLGRILGIDYGERRLGLALSDPSHTIATPRQVVAGEAGLRAELPRLIQEEEVERIVLGLPLNMDGSIGPKARQVLAFKERLERQWRLPVEVWDERLTTFQAECALREGGVPPRRRAELLDKVAAQILLQSYLDSRRPAPPAPG